MPSRLRWQQQPKLIKVAFDREWPVQALRDRAISVAQALISASNSALSGTQPGERLGSPFEHRSICSEAVYQLPRFDKEDVLFVHEPLRESVKSQFTLREQRIIPKSHDQTCLWERVSFGIANLSIQMSEIVS